MSGYSWLLVVTGYLSDAVSHCLLQEPKLQNTSGMVEFLSVAAVESAHENEIYFPAHSHHLSLFVINGSTLDENYFILSCGENWRLFVENYVLCIV